MYTQPAQNAIVWTGAIRLHAEAHHGLGKCDAADYAVLPRRKAGQSIPLGERAAVVLTRSVLEGYFDMPLSAAAKELVSFDPDRELEEWKLTICVGPQGICATAIKKVCRLDPASSPSSFLYIASI